MKKLLSELLILLILLSLIGCQVNNKEEEETEAPDPKIGIILDGDENNVYSAAHIQGIKEAARRVGISEGTFLIRYNTPEDESCYDAIIDCLDNGATMVVSNSYGHQIFMHQAAAEHPEAVFVPISGDTAAMSGLNNLKNAFPRTYESHYVSGVVAGLKIRELAERGELTDENFDENGMVKIGYVAAFPLAEVISGYTAFYLGVRSVYEESAMIVEFTNTWFDIAKDASTADDLMSKGCVIIGQHTDLSGAAAQLQKNMENEKYGFTAYCVGNHASVLDTAPDVALTSACIDWVVLYEYLLRQWQSKQEVSNDWTAGYLEEMVYLSELGEACAEGTEEKIMEVEEAIRSGELQVFDVENFTIGRATPVSMLADVNADDVPEKECLLDGYFHEQEFRSAPYFAIDIDGITKIGLPEN